MRIAVPIVLLVAAGCTSGDAAPSTVERDSGTVRIVQSARPAWGAGDAWRVADAPMLAIGVEDGPDEYQFYRVGGAHRFADGSLVIANAGSSELRFYDAEGRLVTRVGRRGGGPGEFHQFSSLPLWAGEGDTLRVADNGQDRINLYTGSGQFVTTFSFEAQPELPRAFPMDVFPDGSWLGIAYLGGGRLGGHAGTVVETEAAWARYGPRGEWLTELVRLAGRPRWVHEFGNSTHFPYIPLTPDPQVIVGGPGVIQWTGPGPELLVRDTLGTVRTIIRWDPPRRRAVGDIWDRFRAASLAEMTRDDDRRTYEHYYDEPLPLPDEVPVVARMLTDAAGNLWALHYRLPWDEDLAWDVFDPAGRWLGEVVTPPGTRVLEIGRDYVVARHRDDLGVERIHVYALLKRGTP